MVVLTISDWRNVTVSVPLVLDTFNIHLMFGCNHNLIVQSMMACIEPTCQYDQKMAPLYHMVKVKSFDYANFTIKSV